MERRKNNKVMLVTCFLDNYGACLQAFALQSTINYLGYDCEIIRYLEPSGYPKYSNLKNLLRDNIVASMGYACINKEYRHIFKRRVKFDRFRQKYLKFTSKAFYNYNEIEKYKFESGVFVCGSDQIWNPTFYDGNNPVYLLEFVPKNGVRIAYAPSIGLADMPPKYRDDFVRMIDKFTFLSVRERTGLEIIERYTKKSCQVVVDPTLLLNREQWKKYVPYDRTNEEYIFCYLFGEKELYYRTIESIQKKLKCKVYIIPFTQKQRMWNYTIIDDAGPLDFVQYIMNAKIVLTDSFHATAFSINMNTPFYTFLRSKENDDKSMNSRIYSILSEVGLMDRIVDKESMLDVLNEEMDFTNVNKRLEEKRMDGISYLKNALQRND